MGHKDRIPPHLPALANRMIARMPERGRSSGAWLRA